MATSSTSRVPARLRGQTRSTTRLTAVRRRGRPLLLQLKGRIRTGQWSDRIDVSALANGASGWPVTDGGYEPGTYAVSPFSDLLEIPYIAEYGYPSHQANNFRFNCIYQIADTSSGLSMSPFAQETVFNFYLPDFTTGVVQAAALVAPELQLATETEVVRNALARKRTWVAEAAT